MTRKSLISLCLLIGIVALIQSGAPGQEEVVRVITMPSPSTDATSGDALGMVVDGDLWKRWQEARDEALADRATVIVFEITTPGGEVIVAKRFVDDIRALRQDRGIRTAAYIPNHATSAGAMLALACGEVIMGPNGAIGNVIPLEITPFSMKEAGSKSKTEVVTIMTSLERDSGWPWLLLKGMADKTLDLGAYIDHATGEVQIISQDDYDRRADQGLPPNTSWRHFAGKDIAVKLTAEDAAYLKLPVKFCDRREGLLRALEIADRALLEEEIIQIKWPSGSFFNPNFDFDGQYFLSALLLILGIAAAVMELKTPGLGLFGVLSLLCFLGFFMMQADSSSTIALTTSLLLLGFFLLIVEIMIIPGFGVAGTAGIVLIIGSLYVAGVGPQGDSLWEKMVPDTSAEWSKTQFFTIQLLSSVILGTAAAIMLARNLQLVPFLNKTLLSPPILEAAGGKDPSATRSAATPEGTVTLHKGAIGTADTDLRPSGRVRFSKGVVDVVSEGEWIPKGTQVRVTLAKGNRVVVETFGESA